MPTSVSLIVELFCCLRYNTSSSFARYYKDYKKVSAFLSVGRVKSTSQRFRRKVTCIFNILCMNDDHIVTFEYLSYKPLEELTFPTSLMGWE